MSQLAYKVKMLFVGRMGWPVANKKIKNRGSTFTFNAFFGITCLSPSSRSSRSNSTGTASYKKYLLIDFEQINFKKWCILLILCLIGKRMNEYASQEVEIDPLIQW